MSYTEWEALNHGQGPSNDAANNSDPGEHSSDSGSMGSRMKGMENLGEHVPRMQQDNGNTVSYILSTSS